MGFEQTVFDGAEIIRLFVSVWLAVDTNKLEDVDPRYGTHQACGRIKCKDRQSLDEWLSNADGVHVETVSEWYSILHTTAYT